MSSNPHLQMIERMCVKVQDHLNSLRYSETESIQEDMRVAERLLKDARNSKTVRTTDERLSGLEINGYGLDAAVPTK